MRQLRIVDKECEVKVGYDDEQITIILNPLGYLDGRALVKIGDNPEINIDEDDLSWLIETVYTHLKG